MLGKSIPLPRWLWRLSLGQSLGIKRLWLTALMPLAALVAWTTTTQDARAAPPSNGYQVLALSPRVPAGAFPSVDINGRALTTGAGKPVVLLNFWASWCPPCLAEMPSLEVLSQREGPQRLRVVAVNFKESSASVQGFVERNGVGLPVALDPQGEIAKRWGVKVFPSTVVLDASGRARWLVRGEFDWAGPEAVALLNPLLAPPMKAPQPRLKKRLP